MRNTVAKRLRKLARNLSVGMPERQLNPVNFTKKVLVTNREHKDFGKTINIKVSCITHAPRSTRGVYRALKKAFKRGQA